MFSYAVFAEGIEVDFLDGMDDDKRRLAAVRAINKIARDARSQAARKVRDQINFPASFVSQANGRLSVTQQATRASLEARITARSRVTSLAQFIVGGGRPGQTGVTVAVAPGKARLMKRAFTIKLPQGSAPVTDTKYNLGLAIRLRPGQSMRRKMSARKVAGGLYVLYGPSVDQVFRANDGDGVANDIVPDVAEKLRAEFLRLLDLK